MQPFKNKKLLLIIPIAAFIGLFAVNLFGSKPSSNTEPAKAQNQTLPSFSPIEPKQRPTVEHKVGETIVRFNNQSQQQKFLEANNLSSDELKPVEILPNTFTVARPSTQLVAAGALVTENQKYTALLAPNDPFYPQWYTDKVSAPAAWDISTGSASVTVAIIDTGFALNHEDLVGRWAPGGRDFVNSDYDPAAGTTNPFGAGVTHGTETAGLVGATGNNGRGVAGINWGAKILPIQALDDDGIGSTIGVASAIHYAVDQASKVINLSLGTVSPDPILKGELDYALANNIVVVAAAGNCGSPTNYFLSDCNVLGQMIYPANYPEVLAVGTTDSNDIRAVFSSYGANLDVVAPGSGSIRSPSWSPYNTTSSYSTSLYGTSFSSPVVAGIAALYRGYNSGASASATINAITGGTDKTSGMGSQNFTNDYGYGRVNAYRVLSSAAPSSTPSAAAPALSTSSGTSALNSGSTLSKDDYLISSDGRSVLAFQRNGNLALYANFKLVWETGSLGSNANQVSMRSDGSLAVLDSNNQALWTSGTSGNSGAHLSLQNDGNLVIYSSSNSTLWSSNTQNNTDLMSDRAILAPGIGGIARMYPGQSIISADGRFRMVLQLDGNLVLYSGTRPLWASGTDGRSTAFLALQPDGNLVLYDRNAQPLWFSRTDGAGLARLIMQPDGNLVIYDQSNKPRWNTETAGAS